MQNQSRAPKITALSWGRIATQAGVFRDAKLWPGGGRNWDWTETGTDHDVGLQLADFQELLDHAQGSSWSAGASTNAYRCPAEQSA